MQRNFPFATDHIPPTDPTIHPHDKPRLSRQCWAILELLRRGPATNVMLAGIALKYTSRVSDLRAAGFHISATRHEDGIVVYTLERDPI